MRPDVRSAIHLRRELDVGFVLDADRCRASRQDIARHEGLIARIRARYADDPNFELAPAEAEEHNRAYWIDMTGVGHDDEPENSQQRLGNFSELVEDHDNCYSDGAGSNGEGRAAPVPQIETGPSGSACPAVREWPETDPFDIFDSHQSPFVHLRSLTVERAAGGAEGACTGRGRRPQGGPA